MILNYTALTNDLELYGVALPKSVTEARATLLAAREAATTEPTADLAELYAAGKVNAKNVAEHLGNTAALIAARDNMNAALGAVENGCSQTVRSGLRDAGDTILKALAEPFDDAASVVQTAGLYFGSDPTAEQIMAGGVAAVAAHEQLGSALNTLTRIRGLRVSLADCGYGAPEHTEQDVTWWIAGAEDMAALEAAARAYTAPGNAFHNLAAAGFTLRMNTPTEAQRVATGARAATEANEDAAREAALAEHRESWAPSLAVMASQPAAR